VTVGWDGMGWDGMGWMGWDGMGWDGTGWECQTRVEVGLVSGDVKDRQLSQECSVDTGKKSLNEQMKSWNVER